MLAKHKMWLSTNNAPWTHKFKKISKLSKCTVQRTSVKKFALAKDATIEICHKRNIFVHYILIGKLQIQTTVKSA